MNKRYVYILGSSRGDGETRKMVDEAMKHLPGDVVDLNDYKIGYYDYEYQNKDDDYYPLIDELTRLYDVFIFATPIYWYSMSAVMKTFFDRISDLLRVHKDTGRRLRGKEMALISCASDSQIMPEFPMPFIRSADYLGMTFLDNVHGYVRNGELPADVKKDIRSFTKTIASS
ncbi:MAG: NAD(P)H-dependent oxidoreductase [Saprospiraceae bacterium]|nr:NAD(P)H-dependent oxidoreductase [Saprospiraceae bacterium]